jgi:tetratricopeptide (TPR) repeat protein
MRNIIFNLTIIIFFSVNGLFADDDGLNNYKSKNFEEAKKYYEQILATKGNAAASLGLGASQYQLGDIPNAAKAFEDALKSKNINIQDRAYYNLGNALYSQQRMEESVAFFRKALELDPNDDDAKFNYELAKYIVQQQQNQNQDSQDDQQDQQNQQQNDSNNDQDNKPQDTDKQEPDKQEDEESDSSQQEQREAPKSQKQINAEAILDALKDEEKIHQKVKMAQQTKRKFEKDW